MEGADLVVFSHLRWTWVWQRPQQLISRVRAGRRTWFVEQPLATGRAEPMVRTEERDGIRRVWLEVPGDRGFIYFDDPIAREYAQQVRDLVGEVESRLVWLYTPMALPHAELLKPALVVYDVMDDLAAFAKAPPAMRAAQAACLRRADVVFTGGRSLHSGVTSVRSDDVWLFASGVDVQHYAAARYARQPGTPPVAGYVGVIDERLDLALIADLARRLPDWEIRMVGPIYKIDEAAVPRADNIVYLGARTYDELPGVLSQFDVALMPFALNEATRSISPTKTLEYLAAGLPVVSTPIADVMADCDGLVEVAADARGFAQACRDARLGRTPVAAEVEALLRERSWDAIARQMVRIIDERTRTHAV